MNPIWCKSFSLTLNVLSLVLRSFWSFFIQYLPKMPLNQKNPVLGCNFNVLFQKKQFWSKCLWNHFWCDSVNSILTLKFKPKICPRTPEKLIWVSDWPFRSPSDVIPFQKHFWTPSKLLLSKNFPFPSLLGCTCLIYHVYSL